MLKNNKDNIFIVIDTGNSINNTTSNINNSSSINDSAINNSTIDGSITNDSTIDSINNY